MTRFSGFVGEREPPIGAELVRCLTGKAAVLAPYLTSLSPARAQALVTQAGRHGVGPWWRERLITQGLYDALPTAARDALETQAIVSSLQAGLREREFEVILAGLAEQGIPVIALKGLYLARALYPQPGLRPMADMDLMVRVDDLGAVQALLLRLGYACPGTTGHSMATCLARESHLPPFERPGATTVEVHFRLELALAPFPIDHAGLWVRARPWPFGGRPLLVLAPEDLLLHLCLHAAWHHGFDIGLKALIDIVRVVQVEPLDWERCVVRAREWQAEFPVFLALTLAQRLVQAPIPGPVLSALAPRQSAGTVLAMLERTLLAERPADGGHSVSRRRRVDLRNYLSQMSNLKALPDRRAKVAFLLAKAFPSRDWLALQYPVFKGSGWVWVMYSVHWLVHAVRLTRAMTLHPRYWLTVRRLAARRHG